jgi:hypothetical protein
MPGTKKYSINIYWIICACYSHFISVDKFQVSYNYLLFQIVSKKMIFLILCAFFVRAVNFTFVSSIYIIST